MNMKIIFVITININLPRKDLAYFFASRSGEGTGKLAVKSKKENKVERKQSQKC